MQIAVGTSNFIIYKEGDNLVYAYGLELQKPEIKIVGKAGKNLFKNFGEMDLEPWYHLVFKNKNYSYVITYADNNDFGPLSVQYFGSKVSEVKTFVCKPSRRSPALVVVIS